MTLPVVLLMGPTAAGKSRLALWLAQQVPVEIVSVDSAQVYRGMNIGTAKPSAEERAAVPHHLLDILDPAQSYSVAGFRDDAHALIAAIRARGRVPLLVGGSMLYFRTLQAGLSELPAADPALRARLEDEARRLGWPALHARLQQLDPETAARLTPNDRQRIQRALEICALTGMPASTQMRRSTRQGGVAGPLLKMAVAPPERAQLHRNIETRFLEMMRRGFLDEVAALRARGDLHPDLPSMRSVGYRQLWSHLDGACAVEAAVQRGIAATRQMAKRQLTWLRAESDLLWLDPAQADTAARALERLRAGLC